MHIHTAIPEGVLAEKETQETMSRLGVDVRDDGLMVCHVLPSLAVLQ